ncbi:MAG: GTPase HflX, partial [Deltaproteobacteria bacterium]|nr:GTPase HflX [Deltaproteobacteria bacterium]
MTLPSLKPDYKRERVWVVGVWRSRQNPKEFQSSLHELECLIDTAGGELAGSSQQKIDSPDPRTFLGKGKVDEIALLVKINGVQTVAIDDELTPTQNANLETSWNVKVLDRTAVILDIFAKRAHTREGRLQVELAQLRYIQPRLKGMWSHFGKQTGGI